MNKEYRGMKIKVWKNDGGKEVFHDILWFSTRDGFLAIKTGDEISVYPLTSVIKFERWWERPDSYPVPQSVPFDDWSEYDE